MNKGLHVADETRARAFRPPMVYVYEDTRWEYKKLSRDVAHEGVPSEEDMNALGADGWELAGVVSLPEQVHFYWKRLRR